jgi:hypothetical protein
MAYMGGSALAMAEQIRDGYTILTAVQIKRLTDQEMDQLQFEVEKALRDLRSQVVQMDDQPTVQARNRKMTRLTAAIAQIQAARYKRNR